MKKFHIGLSDLKKASNASKDKIKMRLELDIECCYDCPCRKEDSQSPDYCGHPSLPNTFDARNIIDPTADITGFPKLCPLRKENKKQKEK